MANASIDETKCLTGRSAPGAAVPLSSSSGPDRDAKDTGKPVEAVEPVVVAGYAEERALLAVVVRLEDRVPRKQETRFDFGGGCYWVGGIAPEKQDVTAWQRQLAVVVRVPALGTRARSARPPRD